MHGDVFWKWLRFTDRAFALARVGDTPFRSSVLLDLWYAELYMRFRSAPAGVLVPPTPNDLDGDDGGIIAPLTFLVDFDLCLIFLEDLRIFASSIFYNDYI